MGYSNSGTALLFSLEVTPTGNEMYTEYSNMRASNDSYCYSYNFTMSTSVNGVFDFQGMWSMFGREGGDGGREWGRGREGEKVGLRGIEREREEKSVPVYIDFVLNVIINFCTQYHKSLVMAYSTVTL